MVQASAVRSERRREATQLQSRVASPVGGLNFVNSTMDFPVNDAYVLDNIIPKPFGCEIRKGWRNWIPVANKFSAGVRTIIPFSAEQPTFSRLFAAPAVNPSTLHTINTQGAAPVLSLTPSTNSDVPGEWYYTNLVTIGGNFLLAVAAGAGYYTFSSPAGVDAWVEHVNGAGAGQIQWPVGSALTTKDICFVWIWKNRVWFLVRNSSVAYYLPVSQLSGQLTAFDFGQQFSVGGSLLWATTWTYDSGDGIDDSLILASSEGQVVVYVGTDPDSAQTFQLKGRWFAGRFPAGRRNFCQHGGDVLFLSEYGVVSISDLVSGKLHTANLTGSVGYKINPKLSDLVTFYIDSKYWFMTPYASEELLYIGTPIVDVSGNKQHLGMNSLTNAWCTFSGMDTLSAAVWKGQFIFGSSDGMVSRGFTEYLDGTNSAGTVPGTAMTARIQGTFGDYDSPNKNKRMLRIKVYGLGDTDPTFYARFLAEYNTSAPILAPQPDQVIGTSLWDTALWDSGLWSEGGGSFDRWFGVTGYGKKLSLQLAIRGAGRVVYTDHEALHEDGIGL